MHVQQRPRARTLVSSAFFERLVERVRADHGFNRLLAERVVDQALAFLKACADNRGVPLSPSWHVDVGWHAFLLYTREYAEFCHRVAGRFIGGRRQQDVAQALAESGAAWFSRAHDGRPGPLEVRGQKLGLGRLAATIRPVDGDEPAASRDLAGGCHRGRV